MSFGHPAWLWGLWVLVPLALGLWFGARRRQRRLARFADPGTAPRIDLTRPSWRSVAAPVLLLCSVAFVLLALARPRWGEVAEEVHVKGLDMILAVDVSRSMLAEDVAPSRMVLARTLARDIARRLPSDRVGLIGFAGTAATICPLTLDRGALELYLDALDPAMFEGQGTDLGAALRQARETFQRHAGARRILVIISDGEDQEQHVNDEITAAKAEGIAVYCVGVGTLAGAPIPERDGNGRVVGYHQDRDGKPVTSRLEEEALREIASKGGGSYVRASAQAQAEEVVTTLAQLQRDDRQEKLPVRQAERYRWPLAAAFVLLALEAALVPRRREDA